MFCFLITFLHYRKSLSPCLGDSTTDVKTNKRFLFLIPFPHKRLFETLYEGSQPILFLSPTQYSILGPFFIEIQKYIQYRRVGSVFQGSASTYNIPMNITIGIRLKIVPSGLQQKCILGDFPQLLELPLLRTHIGGCFQNIWKAAVSRIFAKYLAKQT